MFIKIVISTILFHLSLCGGISDLRKCADPSCEVKISVGRTTQRYNAIHENILKFNIDEIATIYSKEAGNNTDLWGVEISGKRGYIPKKFIREERIFVKDLNYIVKTDPDSDESSKGPLLIASKEVKADQNSNENFEKINNSILDPIHDEKLTVLTTAEDIEFAAIENFIPPQKTEEQIQQSILQEEHASSINNESQDLQNEQNIIADSKAEPVTNIETKSVTATDSKVEHFADIEAKAATVADSKVEPVVNSETKTTTATDSKPEPDVNSETEAAAVSDSKAEFNVNIEAEASTVADSKAEPPVVNGETKTATVADSIAGHIANIDAKPVTVADSKAKPVVNAEAKTVTGAISKTEHTNIDPSIIMHDLPFASDTVINLQSINQNSKEGRGISDKISGINMNDKEIQEGSTNDKTERMKDENLESNKEEKIIVKPIDNLETGNNQKEIDNEDEGNGNEGEENGSEYVVPSKYEEGKNITDEVSLVDGHDLPLVQPSEELIEDSSSIKKDVSTASVTPETDKPHSFLEAEVSPEIQGSQEYGSVDHGSHFSHISSDLRSSTSAYNSVPIQSPPYLTVDGTVIYPEAEDQPSAYEVVTSPSHQEPHRDQPSIEPTPSIRYSQSISVNGIPLIFKKNINTDANINDGKITLPGSVKLSFDDDHNNSKASLNLDEKKPEFDSIKEKSENMNTELQDSHIIGEQLADTPIFTQEFNTPKPETIIDKKVTDRQITDQDNLQMSEAQGLEETQTSENEKLVEKTLKVFENSEQETILAVSDSTEQKNIPTGSDSAEQERVSSSGSVQKRVQSSSSFTDTILNPKENLVKEDSVEHPRTNDDSSVEPLIANLSFIDPYSTYSGDYSQDSKENEIKVKDRAVEEAADSSLNKEYADFHKESLSIKDKFLLASESMLHWLVESIKLNEGMSLAVEGEFADPRISSGTLVFLLVSAGTIILLYLVHLIMVKISRESPLIEMMNELDRNKRILLEENNNLKKKLCDSNGQIITSGCAEPVELQKLENRCEEVETEVLELREKNQQLESDLETSTANEVELHRMLNELLSNQKEASNFEDSVNSLQQMLDGQREVVESLTSDLALKTRLNDELRNESKESKLKTSKLEYQIEQLTQSMKEMNTSKQEYQHKLMEEESSLLSLREMNEALRQEVEKASHLSNSYYEESHRLTAEMRNLKQKLHSKDAECQVSKEALKRLQLLSDGGDNDVGGKLTEIFKIIEVKSQLSSTEKECTSLKAELVEKGKLQNSLSERIHNLENEASHLRETSSELQKERDEAKSKLAVLTQYYEEKEKQLKKALSSQEGLLQMAEGSAATVSNKIQAYEVELVSCRSQLESLKNELEEQKQSFKIQLVHEEKKLHDNWLAARSAERRQEELRLENAQLRQKLTQMQKDSEHIKSPKRSDTNGSVASPIPMENNFDSMHHPTLPLDLDGLPPLPPPPMISHMFAGRPLIHPGLPPGLPPPPPHLHPHLFGPLPPPPLPDRRLPPAGRIASPPGYDRRSYSPGSDHSHYSDNMYSPTGPRYSPGVSNHRTHSSERKSDYQPSRRNPHSRRGPRSPSPLDSHANRHSPERWYTQSPKGFAKHRRSPAPGEFYENLSDSRSLGSGKVKKTSTPLGLNDR